MAPIHILQSYSPKTHFILSHLLRLGFPNGPFPFIQNSVHTLHHQHECYVSHPSYPINMIILTISGEKYKLWSSSIYSFLYPTVTSCFFGQIFSLGARSQTETKLQTYIKQNIKLWLCIFNLCILHKRLEDKISEFHGTKYSMNLSALNLNMNAISTCYCRNQMYDLCYT
jgi:hypothetical protein